MAIHARDAARAVERLGVDIDHAAKRALREAVYETVHSAKSTNLFQDRTGKTRESVAGEAADYTARVSAAGASTWLERGTRPHEIVAKKSRVLAFQVNGETRFARAVRHPGTAERPFMQQARDHGEQVLDYGIETYIREAMR